MIYNLTDLLARLGAPEVQEKGRMEWHSFDHARNCIAGFAEIRLEAGGEFLVAEMKRLRENYEDDDGQMHDLYEESFFMYAERAARPNHYRVTQIAFDGENYGHPTKPIIELGLGIFHARALDISIRMVEQSFNKMDMLYKETDVPATSPETALAPVAEQIAPKPRRLSSARKAAHASKPPAGQSAPRHLNMTGFANLERVAHTETPRTGFGVVVPFRKRNALHA